MAETIFPADGSKEVILNDPKETLQRIIRERLGEDAERLFLRLMSEEE